MKEEQFKGLSNDAKLLYAFMLDRISLSKKNGWLDEENRAYIIYTIEDTDITLPEPVRTGYTFAGWIGSDGTTAQLEVTVLQGSTGNREYTAIWEANTGTPYKVEHYLMSRLVYSGRLKRV